MADAALPDGDVERTTDGRYVVVDGRRWRATDPSIPDQLRSQLVAQLMAARRGVRAHQDDPSALALARRCVQDAKVALGERGEPWWERPTDAGLAGRAEAAIRTLLRARAPDRTICPSDVARILGQPNWRDHLSLVREVGRELAARRVLTVTQGGVAVDPHTATGAIRYRPGPALEILPTGSR